MLKRHNKHIDIGMNPKQLSCCYGSHVVASLMYWNLPLQPPTCAGFLPSFSAMAFTLSSCRYTEVACIGVRLSYRGVAAQLQWLCQHYSMSATGPLEHCTQSSCIAQDSQYMQKVHSQQEVHTQHQTQSGQVKEACDQKMQGDINTAPYYRALYWPAPPFIYASMSICTYQHTHVHATPYLHA